MPSLGLTCYDGGRCKSHGDPRRTENEELGYKVAECDEKGEESHVIESDRRNRDLNDKE